MSFDERTVVMHVKRVNLRELRYWVRQGWVRPSSGVAGPVFDELDIARIRLLCDLKKDMSLPTDSLPVILSLIDRLHQTRRDLRALTEALEEQPEPVRRSVISKLRSAADRGGRVDDDPLG
jgi:chaperone modulatory protein CbpM